MSHDNKAADITGLMLQHDRFTQWLGIELLAVDKGYCRLQMMIRDEMCNGFGIAHGGICFSVADSALAFASNSHGKKQYPLKRLSHICSLYIPAIVL